MRNLGIFFVFLLAGIIWLYDKFSLIFKLFFIIVLCKIFWIEYKWLIGKNPFEHILSIIDSFKGVTFPEVMGVGLLMTFIIGFIYAASELIRWYKKS